MPLNPGKIAVLSMRIFTILALFGAASCAAETDKSKAAIRREERIAKRMEKRAGKSLVQQADS